MIHPEKGVAAAAFTAASPTNTARPRTKVLDFRFLSQFADTQAENLKGVGMSRVLVVDDESIIGVILRHAFDANGHETMTAGDGRTGIEMAKADHPDAIVLDLMMPGLMNGYDVLDQIRHSVELDEVPVLVLTAVTLTRDHERCLSEGANAVMTKPFDPRDVADVVDGLLSIQTGVLQS